jgi:anti-sigma B factor antagonist
MGTPFTIRDSLHAGTGELAVEGDVDLAVLQPIQEAVTRLLGDDACTSIVVDLSGVTFIDSSGLGLLVSGKRQADEAAKSFRVTGAHGRTAEIIELTGLTTYLLAADPATD